MIIYSSFCAIFRLEWCNATFVVLITGSCVPVQAKESWGYVDVRDGAHMFWWLYYANSSSASYKDLPLVMWLQVCHSSAQCDLSYINSRSSLWKLPSIHIHIAVIPFLFFHLDFISLFWSTSKVAHTPVYFRAVLADLAVVLAILRKLDLLTETLSQEKSLGYVKEDFLDLHFCSIDWEVYFGKYRIFNCLFWFSLFLYK